MFHNEQRLAIQVAFSTWSRDPQSVCHSEEGSPEPTGCERLSIYDGLRGIRDLSFALRPESAGRGRNELLLAS